MSASKKDELLRNLTRRDAQKPPMDVTYENKGIVLEQMIERRGVEQQPAGNDNQVDSNINIDSTNDINSEIDNENDIHNNNDIDIKNDNDIDSDIDIDNNNDINVASNVDIVNQYAVAKETDAIDALLHADKRSAPNKSFKGFYLDPDVAKVLEKLAKKHGKGIQSQMVNEALRMVFISKGLI